MSDHGTIGHLRIVVFGVLLAVFAAVMSSATELPLLWAMIGSGVILVGLVTGDRYLNSD